MYKVSVQDVWIQVLATVESQTLRKVFFSDLILILTSSIIIAGISLHPVTL